MPLAKTNVFLFLKSSQNWWNGPGEKVSSNCQVLQWEEGLINNKIFPHHLDLL